MTSDRFSLKDHLFNADTVGYLGEILGEAGQGLDRQAFIADVMNGLPDLELTQRIEHMATVMTAHLPSKYESAARWILRALPPPLDPSLTDDDFGDFILAPFGEFVARHGATKERVELSLTVLGEITKRFSMERATRTFLNAFPAETMHRLDQWSRDENYHVRRLVSESTRPLLPWAPRVALGVEQPMPLLDQLHADPTRYVTRSVANHLNDISKRDPDLVLGALRRWRELERQAADELAWMDTHALRTLIKNGHPETMEFLGYSIAPAVTVSPVVFVAPRVAIGGSLEFSFSITAERTEPVLVDYVVQFPTRTGNIRTKVFKLKTMQLEAGTTTDLRKRHPLRKNASTFTLWPGVHVLSIQVNGVAMRTAEFELIN